MVLGSYLDLSRDSAEGIRLDLRVQDAQTGNVIASFTVRGKEGKLDQLVTDAGAKLRQKLGIPQVPESEEVAAKASLPANLDASRYYAQGLEKLRSFDPLAARDLFQKAVAADPQHAMSYAGLAAAWSAIGYDLKSAEAARRSFELSTHLPREERSLVEGQYYEAAHEWDKAVNTYKALYGTSPDNLDYGLKLASAQVNAGQGTVGKLLKDDALARETTESMRNLKEILQKINQGQGSVGKLVNEEEFYRNAKLTLQKLDQATEGLEDQGPLSVLGMVVGKLF